MSWPVLTRLAIVMALAGLVGLAIAGLAKAPQCPAPSARSVEALFAPCLETTSRRRVW